MKIPVSWLKEYVDFDFSAEELAEKLTFSGTEVEGVHTVGRSLDGVIVGEILEATPHPTVAHLRICRVTDGQTARTVVCGADNAAVGVKAPLALPGFALPDGTVLQEATVGGVVSQGMLCAEDELELSEDHSGLLILDPQARPGRPLKEELGGPETVLELEVTWNRPDCLSVMGMAREIAALLGRPLRRPRISLVETGPPVAERVRVAVADPRLCPRYMARLLCDVKSGPSPFWMRRRLSLCGVRAISVIVDITNYVLLECGQPLHAFDFGRIAGGTIEVRAARAGEKMRTLDDVERTLPAGTIVIADREQPVALAGVMGGAGSEIGPHTTETLLESAAFDPVAIHAASARLGLATEASRRFERGVDLEGVAWASRRAAALMVEHGGAVAAVGAVDVGANRARPRAIRCRYERARSVTGMPIADAAMVSILENLEIPTVENDAESFTVAVPSFRLDLTEEADLIEEIARMHGLDNVATSAPLSRVVIGADDRPFRAVALCRRVLAGLGLHEIMNYTFISAALQDLFHLADGVEPVALPHPVSADQGLLRSSLLPQMAETLGRNVARQGHRALFFEIGRVFQRGAQGAVAEQTKLAIGLLGSPSDGWRDRRKNVKDEDVFLALKGILTSLTKALHGPPLDYASVSAPCWADGGAAAIRMDGRAIGSLGLLHSDRKAHWRMRGPVALAELELEPLTARAFRVPEIKAIPVFPSVSRDLALVADDSVTHAAIERAILENAPKDLTAIELFDTFKSKEIGEGRKSLAYSLTYQCPERTLTDEEVNESHGAVKRALRAALGVDFRE